MTLTSAGEIVNGTMTGSAMAANGSPGVTARAAALSGQVRAGSVAAGRADGQVTFDASPNMSCGPVSWELRQR